MPLFLAGVATGVLGIQYVQYGNMKKVSDISFVVAWKGLTTKIYIIYIYIHIHIHVSFEPPGSSKHKLNVHMICFEIDWESLVFFRPQEL